MPVNDVLNAYVFRTLPELREKRDQFLLDYNFNRPYWTLNKKPLRFITFCPIPL
jgi:hypothetical protein